MLFSGLISEYPGFVSNLSTYKGRLFFKEGSRLHLIEDMVEKTVLKQKDIISFSFAEKGMWVKFLKKNNKDNKIFNELYEIDKLDKVLAKSDMPVASGKLSGEHCVIHKTRRDDRKLLVLNLNTGKVESTRPIDGPLYRFTIDENYIFVRTGFGFVACFDYSLSEIWKKEYEKRNNFRGILNPYLFNDMVLVNIGVNPKNRKQGEILALSKKDGSLIWSKEFEKEASNCILIDDKIHIACDRRIIVLDAATGNCEVDEPSGFERGGNYETLWSDGKYLFMISLNEQAIRIFSKDGKMLKQELKIPEPYLPQEGKPLVYLNNQYYLPLTTEDSLLKGVKYGLLIIRQSDNNNADNIDIETWPVQRIVKKIDDHGEGEKYNVSITGRKIEDVIRYGEISLKEVASVNGSQIYSDERRNLKFNGKIVFSTNFDDLGPDAEERVKEMVSRAEDWVSTDSKIDGKMIKNGQEQGGRVDGAPSRSLASA